MYNLKHTFKQVAKPMIKLAVVSGCFYFIYLKLATNTSVSWNEFSNSLKLIFDKGFLIIIFVFILSAINWLLEILKWKVLVNTQQKLNYKSALKQCLSALTASLITPNRVGDYVAKAIYYPKDKAKKIVGLNAIGQFTQLFITLVFGIMGLIYMYLNFGLNASINLNFIWILVAVILILSMSKYGRFYINRVKQFYISIPLLSHLKVLGISLLRYVVFSHQFYLLILVFGLQIVYLPSMMAIFSMYLLASIVPPLAILDWAVKGSVAVFVFGFLHANTFLILEISLLMWALNFAIPALIGSVFVFQYKTSKALAPSL